MVDPREWALAVARLERHLTPADLRPARVRRKRDVAKHRPGGDGLDFATAIVAAVDEAAARLIDEATAWDRIMAAARTAQRACRSWRELGQSWAYGWYGLADGRGGGVETYLEVVERELADPQSPWNRLPWDTDLDSRAVR